MEDLDHQETFGPRAGIKLEIDQASLILHRHNYGKYCKSLTYINRGFNNRTYIVTSEEDGKEYIIRISSGRDFPRMKTENEVASITYLSKKFPHLPLPKILGFCSDNKQSGIGNEYILMEKLHGIPLDEIFKDLSFKQQKQILKEIATILKDIKSIQFQKIGSLEFSKQIGDLHGLGVNLEKIDLEKDICVGPGLEAKDGPFDKYLDYLRACGNIELKYLKKCPFMLQGERSDLVPRIEAFLQTICNHETTPLSPEVFNVPFVMTHGDFEPRNLLVDKDSLKISGVLDFEFSGSFPIDDDWFAGFAWFGADTSEWSIFNEEPLVDDDHFHPNLVAPIKNYFLKQCQLNKVAIPIVSEQEHETRAMLYYFKCNICPWWLRDKLDHVPENWLSQRDDARRRVKIVLEKFGF